jgi:hypothetical protein
MSVARWLVVVAVISIALLLVLYLTWYFVPELIAELANF